MKYGDLFSGFGGATLGAINRGYVPLWAVDKDSYVAKVANRNFNHKTIVEDVLDIDPRELEKVDVLHASPPCINYSFGKHGREEKPTDIQYAKKIVEFAEVMKPLFITVENVKSYCKGDGYKVLVDGLASSKYRVVTYDLNAAVFGVPQTRQRIVIWAGRDGVGHNLDHCYKYYPKSWYSAIDDLIPFLEESAFAQWQLDAFRANGFDPYINNSMYVVDGQNSRGGAMPTIRWSHEPIFTIVASVYRAPIRVCVRYKNVVKLNTRSIARLQSFPDSFRLSGQRQVDMQGIGNAVPPLMYERFLEGIYY